MIFSENTKVQQGSRLCSRVAELIFPDPFRTREYERFLQPGSATAIAARRPEARTRPDTDNNARTVAVGATIASVVPIRVINSRLMSETLRARFVAPLSCPSRRRQAYQGGHCTCCKNTHYCGLRRTPECHILSFPTRKIHPIWASSIIDSLGHTGYLSE